MSKGLSLARAKVVNRIETEPDASESPSKKEADLSPDHHSPTNCKVLSHAHDSRTLRLLLEGSPVGYFTSLRRDKGIAYHCHNIFRVQ
jgi:hypothetical protein